MVRAAGGKDDAAARAALHRLCETYWFPIYLYCRRLGTVETNAADLVQGFFLRLIEKRAVLEGIRAESRFRSYLKRAFDHYSHNERDKARAIRRGGEAEHYSLEVDFLAAERRFASEPLLTLSPDRAYERLCALATMSRALARLRSAYELRGVLARYDALLPCLDGAGSNEEIARALDVSVATAAVAISRFRRQFRETLLEEILDAVSDPGEAEAELRALRAALTD